MLQRFQQNLKNDLIAGFLVVIPLATTIWLTITVARWSVDLLTRVPKQINPFDGFDPILTNILNLLVGFYSTFAVNFANWLNGSEYCGANGY